MNNIYVLFAKILDIYKKMVYNLVNQDGNVSHRKAVSLFSDLDVIVLNMIVESVGIDDEPCLFNRLLEYKNNISN